MSLWRKEAFERFPELRTELQRSKTPMAYWIELQFAFDEAYRKGNIELFTSILNYADWCIHAPRPNPAVNELATCIYVAFFEHMPAVSNDVELDRNALGLSILHWPGSTITHPHVKELHEKLVAGDTAKRLRANS
jgi:hypothetical protein